VSRYIWKYVVPVDDAEHRIDIPIGSPIVHVANQEHRWLTFWADVSDLDPLVRRTFRVFGTGHRIESDWRYIGSAFDGPFVWHLFEGITT
jgi:hypothetical protein